MGIQLEPVKYACPAIVLAATLITNFALNAILPTTLQDIQTVKLLENAANALYQTAMNVILFQIHVKNAKMAMDAN